MVVSLYPSTTMKLQCQGGLVWYRSSRSSDRFVLGKAFQVRDHCIYVSPFVSVYSGKPSKITASRPSHCFRAVPNEDAYAANLLPGTAIVTPRTDGEPGAWCHVIVARCCTHLLIHSYPMDGDSAATILGQLTFPAPFAGWVEQEVTFSELSVLPAYGTIWVVGANGVPFSRKLKFWLTSLLKD